MEKFVCAEIPISAGSTKNNTSMVFVCKSALSESKKFTTTASNCKQGTCRSRPECPGRSIRVDCPNSPNVENPANLEYLPISDDFYTDMSQAIYHQYEWQELVLNNLPASKILEIQKEFKYPIRTNDSHSSSSSRHENGSFSSNSIVPADPRTKIYGYNRSKDANITSLDLKGGKAKTYHPDFKHFRIRYQSVNDAELDQINNKPAISEQEHKEYLGRIISFMSERGMTLPNTDAPSNYTNQYVWTLSYGAVGAFSGEGFIAMRLIWENDNIGNNKTSNQRNRKPCKVPTYVDLIATASPVYFNMTTYEPNPLAQQNGWAYPLRIPITRDFCGKFQQKYSENLEPIAYYDEECHVLTIHVPDLYTEENGFVKYTYFKETANVGNPDFDYYQEDALVAFDGSFKLLKRKFNSPGANDFSYSRSPIADREQSQLTESNPDETYILAQVSEYVLMKSAYFDGYEETLFSYSNPIRDYVLDANAMSYTGVVAPLLNGGTGSMDISMMNPDPGSLNGYTWGMDPYVFNQDAGGGEVENDENLPHLEGDNPRTLIREHFAGPTNVTFYLTGFGSFGVLDSDIADGKKFCAETISEIPRQRLATPTEIFSVVALHEMVHAVHNSNGMTWLMPTEGIALSMETDSHYSKGIFTAYRARNYAQRIVRMTRGNRTGISNDGQGVSTYGIGLFWKYMADHFDHNYQVQRRTADILSNETAGPLFDAADFSSPYVAPAINNTGSAAALDKSLKELFNRNYADVWFDFSVAITLFRNNKSIPKQYRSIWPYFIFSTQYTGFQDFIDTMNIFGLSTSFVDWWEKQETNQLIPSDWSTSYTGQTIIRTLPETFTDSCKNNMTFSFNVEHNVNEILVNIDQGDWKIIVVQYTEESNEHSSSSSSSSRSKSKSSDRILDGTWIQDGPYKISEGSSMVLKIANKKKPAYTVSGNIRLICVNMSEFLGDGTSLDHYFQPEPNTGTIRLDATYVA